MKEALYQYTESNKDTAGIDTMVAVNMMLEKHDYSGYLSEKASESMNAIFLMMDYILGLGDDEKKRFLNTVTELSKAFALCATTPEAQELNVEIRFFKAVKVGLMKSISDGSCKKIHVQMEDRLNQLISKSVISEAVVNIYESLGLENAGYTTLLNYVQKILQERPLTEQLSMPATLQHTG